MLALIGAAVAATLKVGPTETYTTIEAAVAAAADGDTISVAAGSYSTTLDLRGRDLNLVGSAGPYSTTIVSAATIYLDAGSLEGFRIDSSATTAIYVDAGSPVMRELVVDAPVTNGIWIANGSPIIEECLVVDSGKSNVVSTGGEPDVRRTVAVDAAKYNFYFKGTPTLTNSVSIGSPVGVTSVSATGTWSHNVVLGGTDALYLANDTTFTNGVYGDTSYVVECKGGEPTFAGGLGFDTFAAKGCAATALDGLSEGDPGFADWAPGASLYEMDLHPGTGSPLIDAGTGLDVDGTQADLGVFGGIQGAWRDRDGDGVPVVFDCDDHTASRYPGAVEREDGEDQDCDGLIDEDVPVDTGDTGTDTGGDTGGDTGTSADIDQDGYSTPLDCGDHNVATYPGAVELLDSVDNDCDGRVDEGTAGGDDDGDGWSVLAGDCDDTDPAVNPGAEEVPRNGIADDCTGVDSAPKHQDNDDDGYLDDEDCDDTDPSTYPGAPDPTDGKDDDCDGLADDDELNADADGDGVTPAEGDCDDHDTNFSPRAVDVPDDYVDQDCTGEDNYDVDRDGHAAPASGGEDCDDLLSTSYPGAEENCVDGVDNDCDLEIDEGCDGDTGDGGGDDCGCGAGGGAGALAVAGALTAAILRRRVINS